MKDFGLVSAKLLQKSGIQKNEVIRVFGKAANDSQRPTSTLANSQSRQSNLCPSCFRETPQVAATMFWGNYGGLGDSGNRQKKNELRALNSLFNPLKYQYINALHFRFSVFRIFPSNAVRE